MKEINYSNINIYNISESISGISYVSHFVGFSLFILLFICVIPCILIDDNWIKDMFDLIVSSGPLLIIGMSFIFILCPIYFLLRFFMELFRIINNRKDFYLKPNIKYIKLNSDKIFVKNTIDKYDLTIEKSDITDVFLSGTVKTVTGITKNKTPKITSFVENLTMTIKTEKDDYILCPQILARDYLEQGIKISDIDIFVLLKMEITFYKNYFKKVHVHFDYSKTDTISAQKAIELESWAIQNL